MWTEAHECTWRRNAGTKPQTAIGVLAHLGPTEAHRSVRGIHAEVDFDFPHSTRARCNRLAALVRDSRGESFTILPLKHFTVFVTIKDALQFEIEQQS
jgi:hypothetical protein